MALKLSYVLALRKPFLKPAQTIVSPRNAIFHPEAVSAVLINMEFKWDSGSAERLNKV